MIGGYFTRNQGAVARACSAIVAVVFAVSAVSALVGFNIVRVLVPAFGAWAFACNLQASIGRPRRILAIVVQIVTLVIMLVLIFILLMFTEGSGWQDVPAWVWLIMVLLILIPGIAIVDGIRAYREEA